MGKEKRREASDIGLAVKLRNRVASGCEPMSAAVAEGITADRLAEWEVLAADGVAPYAGLFESIRRDHPSFRVPLPEVEVSRECSALSYLPEGTVEKIARIVGDEIFLEVGANRAACDAATRSLLLREAVRGKSVQARMSALRALAASMEKASTQVAVNVAPSLNFGVAR